MKKYIVTINRQFGSLGRPIAAKIAEALGIDYYDRDIVEETAKKMNIQMSTVFEQEEKERSSFFYMQFPLGHGNSELQNKIFETQRQIILNIADKGSCIIVGRCADYILGKMPNHISIYITANFHNFFITKFLVAKRNVASNCPTEEEDILKHLTNVFS